MKTTPKAPLGYETKPDFYFNRPRSEMLPLVPVNCRRVLDVGCGAGTFGELLKQTREVEVWGVEPVKSAAEVASAKLDHVINSTFGPETGLPPGTFECVVFNDVLEHMVAPERALRYAKLLLSPGGAVVASIPNIQYLAVIWQLLFQAQWEYEDSGVLDKTHLRFFTKSSIVKMFQSEGYLVESIRGINAYGAPPWTGALVRYAYEVANVLFLGKLAEMRFPQFAAVAKAALRT
jgi:2-polyprenyl-3-methyl-5-hydroxy-6-metoxy-1,4-benzoquinol methylase